MLNSGDPPDDARINPILQSGAKGAIALAGFATAVVFALWLCFYLLIFLPRSVAP